MPRAHRRRPALLTGSLLAAAFVSYPTDARADDVVAGLTLAGGAFVNPRNHDVDVGGVFAADLTVGYGTNEGDLLLVPELGGELAQAADVYDRMIVRGYGGVRLASRGEVAFSLHTHFGLAYANGLDDDALLRRFGPTLDAGLGVHFQVAPSFALGPRLTWVTQQAVNAGSGVDGSHWVVLGIEAAYWDLGTTP